MFGADIPHSEGTAPHTLDTMRTWFSGLSQNELRAILGTRAVDVYGLDLAELQRIADEVGPAVDDLMPLAETEVGTADRPAGFQATNGRNQ
jgi:hypothetical protein